MLQTEWSLTWRWLWPGGRGDIVMWVGIPNACEEHGRFANNVPLL